MQRLSGEAFRHFEELYDCVNKSFEETRRETEKKLRRLETSIRWHFFLVFLIVLLSWFFWTRVVHHDADKRLNSSERRISGRNSLFLFNVVWIRGLGYRRDAYQRPGLLAHHAQAGHCQR